MPPPHFLGYTKTVMEKNIETAAVKVTPKDFFLWSGAMIALYVSIFSFISLIFNYLNYVFPSSLRYYRIDPYLSGVSYEMALLVVFFPLFLILMWFIHKSIKLDATRALVWVRRWALYLTLFIAGLALAADLVTLVMYFFNGDVTVRFALKVLVLLLVLGGVFLHFLADLRGYWQKNPAKARTLGLAAGVLVIVTILVGFFIIGTPWQARQYRFDEQKVNNLQQIQSEVINYWRIKQTLPASLADLKDPISDISVPRDPQTNQQYEYRVQGTHTFSLCAQFNASSKSEYLYRGNEPAFVSGYPTSNKINSWTHSAGRVCFVRTIDPSRYPPFK